ncbi:MAG: hypothetical protein ACRERD_20275 [Candidatus Binatia bacterium]
MSELLLIFLLVVTIGALGVLLYKYLTLKSRIEARARRPSAMTAGKRITNKRVFVATVVTLSRSLLSQSPAWHTDLNLMPRKKAQLPSAVEALRRVRKALPPPSRVKADEKKYRRAAVQQIARKEVEREMREE